MKKTLVSILCFCLAYFYSTAGAKNPPEIIATPTDITLPETTVGFPSGAQFTVSAHDLPTPVGYIDLAALSVIEVSIDGVVWTLGASIPYTNGQLAPTTVYLRTSEFVGVGPGSDVMNVFDDFDPGNPVTTTHVNINWSVLPIVGGIYVDPYAITGLSSSLGFPSDPFLISVTADFLYPQDGSLAVTGTPFLEFSNDGINFTPTSSIDYYTIDLDLYMSNALYVRISDAAPQGSFSGTITISGGSVAPVTITVNGGVARMYYNTKAALGLNNIGSWSSTIDGTGPSPADFSQGYDLLNIIDPSNTGINGVWDMSGPFCKISVGDGVSPVTLTIPAGADSVTSASKIDVNNNATLRILSNSIPVLNKIDIGSTVEFAQAGVAATDVIKIPSINYGNLKLTNGLKYFDGNISVGGNLIVDGVAGIGGSKMYPSVVTCYADASFLNGTTFEPGPSGDSSRFVLAMEKGSGIQNIISDGTPLKLLLLQRLGSSAETINVSAGTEMQLGGTKGGGLFLKTANTTVSTTGGKWSLVNAATATVNNSLGKINSNGTSFEILKNAFGYYPINTSAPGRLIFSPGSVINNLTVNMQNYTAANDNIGVNDVAITGTLNLQNGKLLVNSGSTLSLASSASVLGGSVNAYVDGALKRTGTSAFTFPVGNGNKYAPVDMLNYSGNDTYTVQYTKQDYANHTIDPATLALYPNYTISDQEYWTITPGIVDPGSSVDLVFNYTDAASHINQPDQLRIAHFDGTDWNDLAGIADAANSNTNGKVTLTGVSTFSPFTFSGTTPTVVPLKLSVFTAKKENNSVKLNWTTEQEINSKTFVIERSADQHKWNEITRLNAAGNSSQKINYTTTDFNPAKGVNYYRLKQIDLDGKFNYSEIRSVYFGNDVNIVLVPNPASDKVTVYLPGNATMLSIQLFNANGQLMKTISTADESIQINLVGFSKGIYTLKVNGKQLNGVRELLVE